MSRKFTRRQALRIAGAAGAALAALAASGDAARQLIDAHGYTSTLHQNPLLNAAFSSSSPVARENRLPGTTAWEISAGANTSFIKGYAGRVSALPGETVPLYISSISPVRYNIDVYRIGWYNGKGGRLISSQYHLTSKAQGYWTQNTGLADCPSCLYDPQTVTIDVDWETSLELPVGLDWVSGVYLIKLTAANNSQSYIPLIVREPNDQASILVSIPVNTYQAYNAWGGSSLYRLLGKQTFGESGLTKATKVSFNRPYDRSAGAGDFLSWDIHTVRWLERILADVSYTTNVDVAEHPESLLDHQCFLSTAHDEYWTKSMRDGVEAARDNGVSLAFFGANASYWQARLEPDNAGNANRTLVCYKVETYANDPLAALDLDPMYPNQPDIVTARWRDPIVNRPENALLGLMYSSYINYARRGWYYLPDWVVRDGELAGIAVGTGLAPGQHIKGGLLGYEYDSLFDNGQTPQSLVVIAQSPVTNVYGVQQIACTAYYLAGSGAMVFDAGSIWWGWGLDEPSFVGADEGNFLMGSEPIKNLSLNVLRAMLAASPPKQ